jgi:hypothetical protein
MVITLFWKTLIKVFSYGQHVHNIGSCILVLIKNMNKIKHINPNEIFTIDGKNKCHGIRLNLIWFGRQQNLKWTLG